MRMFLDSAKVDEIRFALEHWDIDGVTTNPRHVAATGRSQAAVLEEIAALFAGTDKPVSVEVNPHLTDWREIVAAGEQLARMSDNFVIKVGASDAGFRAVRELSSRGIPTNLTLVFSVAQAWLAARGGATYISPFIGWKEQFGDDGQQLVADVAQMLSMHGYPSQIIAAAVRTGEHVRSAALAGAHCVTAGRDVYADVCNNPYTDYGVKVFGAAWDATPAE
ncbi:MAG: transaldolase family protein [Planctomycetaceae bacterium]